VIVSHVTGALQYIRIYFWLGQIKFNNQFRGVGSAIECIVLKPGPMNRLMIQLTRDWKRAGFKNSS
jgi:hypothetical protein